MRHRRIITLILAGVLAGSTAVPAFAQSEDKPTGLDRARQAAMQALDLAADDGDELPPAVPPGQAKDRPGKGNEKNDKSERVTGRARAAAAIASSLAKGNAFAKDNGNGNGFGRGHALEVIGLLLAGGESPDSLEADENHGAAVSAMVRTYNELKARERAEG